MTKYLLIITALLFASCSSVKVDYVGQSFPPVKNTKLYFSMKEIKRPYEVIGKAIITAPSTMSSSTVKKKMLKTADAKGADGVVILSFNEVRTGSYGYMNYPSMWNMYGIKEFNECPNGMGPFWDNLYYPGMYDQSRICYYDYKIIALFIRYKK